MDQGKLAQQLREQGAAVGVSRQGNILRLDARPCPDVVNDRWLRAIHDCPRIRELYLAGSSVTDAGVRSLGSLERLHTLDLQQTSVTDGLMPFLAELPALKILLVRGTHVTADCVARIRKQMTGTRIVVE